MLRVVAEPGGAATLAALVSRRYEPKPNERVGILVCGGNTSAVDFSRGLGKQEERRNASLSNPSAANSH